MPAPVGAYNYGFIPGSNRSNKAGGDDYQGVQPTYKQDQIGNAQNPSSQYNPDTGRNENPSAPVGPDTAFPTAAPVVPAASGAPNDLGQAQSFDHGFTNFQSLIQANRQAILGPGSGYAPTVDPAQTMTGGMSMLDGALNNIYQRTAAAPTGKTWNGSEWTGGDVPKPVPLPGQAGYVAPAPPSPTPAPRPPRGGDDAPAIAPKATPPSPVTMNPSPAAPSPSPPPQGSVAPRQVQGASPADDSESSGQGKFRFLGGGY